MAKNSDLITWSNTFACGIKIIDDQHKSMVNLVNDMYNHITGNEWEEQEYLRRVLTTAVKYIRVHFTTEERIFIGTKFVGYLEHKKEHDHFILTVTDRIKEFQSGKRVSLTSFTNFLKDWILTHIAVMDKQYFIYLKQIAVRRPDGRYVISMINKNSQMM